MGSTVQRNWQWWLRYAVWFAIIVGLNAWSLYRSWMGYYSDGCRELGWPITFFEQCSQRADGIYPHWFLLDLAVAILIPGLVAHVTRDGLRILIHRARTWGTPFEGTEPPKLMLRFRLRTLLLIFVVVAILGT